jgi:hypothetical protein
LGEERRERLITGRSPRGHAQAHGFAGDIAFLESARSADVSDTHAPRAPQVWKLLEGWARRRPREAALAALLAVVAVGAAVFSASPSGARYLRVAFASGTIAPLPARLDKKSKFAGDAWTSAQILLALRENDPGYAGKVGVRQIDRFFRQIAGPECTCWRKLPQGQYPNNVGVTGWVLWALGAYGIPATKGEVEHLLATQNKEGWWPMFSDSKSARSASSYATAVAALALQSQAGVKAYQGERERLLKSAQRGAEWLKAHAVSGKTRWKDYPAWPDAAKQGEFLGLSGFALFALHRVGAPALVEFDRDWLRGLPDEPPAAQASDSAPKPVPIGKRSVPDETRHFALPWAIAATVLAYPSGSLSERMRAMRWLERALAPGASLYAVSGAKDPELAAELLFALRDYPEAVRGN